VGSWCAACPDASVLASVANRRGQGEAMKREKWMLIRYVLSGVYACCFLACGDAEDADDRGSDPAYEPCAGKSCGDSCRSCDPADSTCSETEEPKRCGPDGTCEDAPVECPAG